MSTPTTDQLEQKALQPASYENDGERISQRSAADTIALLKFARKNRISTAKAFRAIGVVRLSTPGDEI